MKLAKLDPAAPAVVLALAAAPQLGRILEITHNVAGLGTLVATLVTALGLGLNSTKWVHDDRAKRVAKALLSDPEITIDQYRAVWAPEVDREAISRELRTHLEAIDRATENEVADALLNGLRYRTAHPHEKPFCDSLLIFLRASRFEDLRTTKAVLQAALSVAPYDELNLYNSRTLSDSGPVPGIVVGAPNVKAEYACAADATLVRRMFRLLKQADLARSTSMAVGTFVSDGSQPGTESQEESLVISRSVAGKLLNVLGETH